MTGIVHSTSKCNRC